MAVVETARRAMVTASTTGPRFCMDSIEADMAYRECFGSIWVWRVQTTMKSMVQGTTSSEQVHWAVSRYDGSQSHCSGDADDHDGVSMMIPREVKAIRSGAGDGDDSDDSLLGALSH